MYTIANPFKRPRLQKDQNCCHLWLNQWYRSIFPFLRTHTVHQKIEQVDKTRFGLFQVTKLIGKNAVGLNLLNHFNIRLIPHVAKTKPFLEQPEDSSLHISAEQTPVQKLYNSEQVVERILSHRNQRQRY